MPKEGEEVVGVRVVEIQDEDSRKIERRRRRGGGSRRRDGAAAVDRGGVGDHRGSKKKGSPRGSLKNGSTLRGEG